MSDVTVAFWSATLGYDVVAFPDADADFVVLADTAGNRFRIVDARHG